MDESPLQLVSKIGSKLAKLTLTRFNKSLFLDSLKQAEIALSKIEQPQSLEASNKVEALRKLEAATKPLRKSISKHGLLHQNDKDVRLSVATCISELFWILAPEPPFEDKDLRGVFELFVSLFKELGNTGCPFFSKRVKILEIVARCKCFVIMLDMDCNDLVVQMFDNFFSVVRLCSEPHLSSLINHILSIMTHILNEEASQPLLEAVLRNLVKQEKDASSAAFQLAVSVIQNCAETLEPFVCGFLTSCFLDRDTVESDLKEFYHEIIFKIFQCSPQMLLAIIPTLIQELQIDQVDVRIKAVNLIGKLSALPENCLANRYPELFAEFLKRFSDKSAEVRLSALQCAKACYLANPFRRQSLEILNAIESRLLDFDDRVRTEAVVVACDLARFHLKFVPAKLISEASERLRDKKISVRKKALQKLLEVYQDYCKKCSEGEMTICDHFEQIPCKILLLCYDKDCKEFRTQNIEQILVEDLFPVLEIEESTRHWVHLFSLFTSLHVKALHCILSQKQRLRTEMQLYLSLRKKEKENSPEETQKRMKISFMKMSASFADPCKAEEIFWKLNEMKDNKIFTALEELLDDLTIKNAKIARDKFLRLIGDRHPEFDFLQLLSSKCLYIFDSEHVRCIVDNLSSRKFEDKNLEASSTELLLAIISVFPSLLRGSELQFGKLLEGNNLINDKLIKVLAKAGPHISVKFSDIYPLLERLCLEGTRAQSKSAVSAIASLSGASQQFVFAELCKGLVDSLHSGQNVPTVLQSLGCIAQYSVSSFESQNEDITHYINKNIIQVELLNVFASCDGNSGCDTICKLRIYGLKTLVKSFLPHRGSHVNRKINDLLDVLSEMLQKADAFNGHIFCENNDAHVRLAAAKAVLQLSRRWDLHISPRIFCSTILMAKVSSAFVRRTFIDKTHKLLKARALPSRYACAFALTVSDCQKDLRDDSSKYMAEFIKDCSREARIRQNSAVQGVSITDYPAYIVVFLIHILAHDIGFPSEDCQDDGMIAQFFCPLFSFLQALVNASIVDGDMDLVNDAVLYLLSIFRAIKRAEDAVDAHRTPKLHILADIGVSIVKELNRNEISSRAPGLILLPSSLYQFSPAKKSREVRFEQSFVARVVQILKSHISLPATTVRKRSQKRQEESKHSDFKNTTLKLVACKQLDLPCGTIDSGNKNVGLETNMECKEKQAYSSSTHVAEHSKCFTVDKSKIGGSRSSAAILEKELHSSCDSVTMDLSLTQSQVSSQKMERTASLKENIAPVAGIIAEPSRYSRVKDLCSAKMSNHCEEAELLCLDGKSEETNGGNSLSQREALLEEDSNNLYWRHGNRHKTVDTFSDYSPQQLQILSKQERGKFCGRTVRLAGAAKGKRGRQVLEETSASEIVNINNDAVARRTRSRKV